MKKGPFNQMVAEQLDVYRKKNETQFSPHTIYKKLIQAVSQT